MKLIQRERLEVENHGGSHKQKAFDKVFNAEDNQHDYYNSIGINHSILREGADIDIFKPVTVKQQTQSNHGADVEFHGAIYMI